MRELHWHATAAEWAFVIEGRVRTTVIDPQGGAETNEFEPGRRLVLPPRPRPHAGMPGRRAHALHPDLRQRLLLRVRHLQHHRLDRPHAQGRSWRKTSACPSRPSTASRRRRSTSPAARCRPEKPAVPLQGWKQPPLTHKYQLLARPPHRVFKGGREWRVDSSSFPISQDGHGRDPRPRSGRPARAALAPDRRRVALCHRRRHQRHDVRIARPVPNRDARERRRRLHPARIRPLDRKRRVPSRAEC